MICKKLVISAPFGNYFSFTGAVSTVGTYTLACRAGFFKRWWRVATTVRYNRRSQSWINKLGLPNPGIDSLTSADVYGKVLSVMGFDADDWYNLALCALHLNASAVELNLSCPNVAHRNDVALAVKSLVKHGVLTIAKLAPLRWMETARTMIDHGCVCFHCCNTIQTPGGGLSGKPLKQYSLCAVQELRAKYGNYVKLIGGGGVTCEADVDEYLTAGADSVSIASMLLNPFNWRKVPKLIARMEPKA